jgi:hypothetical protein
MHVQIGYGKECCMDLSHSLWHMGERSWEIDSYNLEFLEHYMES